MLKLLNMLEYFKPVFYAEFNGVQFYIKKSIFSSKYTIYKKNLKVYDRMNDNRHEWELIPFMWSSGEPYIDAFYFWCEQQRQDFFDYKIERYK